MRIQASDFKIAVVYNHETEIKKGPPQELIALQDTTNATYHVFNTLISLGYPVVLVAARESLQQFEMDLGRYSPSNTFVFFNCDGFNGETWGAIRVAEIIERLGFAHTGSSAEAIAVVTDKARASRRLRQAGIPTPAFEVFHQPSSQSRLAFPLIVKPLIEDASLGIDLGSVVMDPVSLEQRTRYVIDTYTQPAHVEEFIGGREFSVSLWGNGTIEVLPLYEQDYSAIEDPLHCLLTYEAKWLPESPYYHNITVRCPAEIAQPEAEMVRHTVLRAYRALGLRDFCRIDIRLFNGTPYVIDINDLPDLCPDSGFARTTQIAGYSYPQTIERILQLALAREGWNKPTYETNFSSNSLRWTTDSSDYRPGGSL